MDYYNFIQMTSDGPNEYNGSSEARLDPLETEEQGEDVYLLPANATFIEPPQAGENEIQVFDTDMETWSVQAKTVYLYYHEQGPIVSKDQVDEITYREVAEAGEQKAKTLKLVAGAGACPEWDTFILERDALVDEGNQFIIDNGLT